MENRGVQDYLSTEIGSKEKAKSLKTFLKLKLIKGDDNLRVFQNTAGF